MERKRHLPMIFMAVILLFVVGAIQQQQQQQRQYSNGGVNTKSIRYFSNCNHGTNLDLDDDYDDDAYSLAREQSFGFFYDITAEHWNLHRQLYLQHENHRYPDKPLTFNPQANEEDVLPEIYAKRGGFPGWSSYEAWYQNVSVARTNYDDNGDEQIYWDNQRIVMNSSIQYPFQCCVSYAPFCPPLFIL